MSTPRDSSLANEIVGQIGAFPTDSREIVGQGAVNHVFVVTTTEEKLVVRFHRDPLDTDDYAAEEWCLQTLKEEIPVPKCIARGICEGIRFIVQSFVEGELGDCRRSPDLWRSLGQYARIINEVPLDASAPDCLFPRFGRDLLQNWYSHLDYNLAALTPTDDLLMLEAYDLRHQESLRRAFSNLRRRVTRFGLTHGDLVPKNILLPPNFPPVVIDWGSAGTGAAPYQDYLRVRQDDAKEGFTTDDLECFAQGYGTPVRQLASTMDDLCLLNKIDLVRWAIDCRPDRLEGCVTLARQAVLQRFG